MRKFLCSLLHSPAGLGFSLWPVGRRAAAGCGGGYIRLFNSLEGGRVTAVCEKKNHSLECAGDALTDDIKVFSDFDEFIDSGLFDAVMPCNYFYEHEPFAVRAKRLCRSSTPNGTRTRS